MHWYCVYYARVVQAVKPLSVHANIKKAGVERERVKPSSIKYHGKIKKLKSESEHVQSLLL
jgi:hypothetical protein